MSDPTGSGVDGDATPITAAVDLSWIPLGAGGHVVRWNGKVYEAIKAVVERRSRYDLYHTALEVVVPRGRFAIESAPIPDRRWWERGVVAEGPVGVRWLGRFRLFRYEIHRWEAGWIPDRGEAVATVRVTEDPARAERVLDLVPEVPTPVWGRDELGTGDMWNSNSLISWVLVMAGIDVDDLGPPAGGRAPGWDAGLVVARRQLVADRSKLDVGARAHRRRAEREASLRALLEPGETVVAQRRGVMVTDRRVVFAWERLGTGWHCDAVAFAEITRWSVGHRHDERPLIRLEHPTHLRLERVPAHRVLRFAWGNAEAEVPHDDVTLSFGSGRDEAFRAIVDRLGQMGTPRAEDFAATLPGTREERTRGSRGLYLRTFRSR